jgi:hypothetical protein
VAPGEQNVQSLIEGRNVKPRDVIIVSNEGLEASLWQQKINIFPKILFSVSNLRE